MKKKTLEILYHLDLKYTPVKHAFNIYCKQA